MSSQPTSSSPAKVWDGPTVEEYLGPLKVTEGIVNRFEQPNAHRRAPDNVPAELYAAVVNDDTEEVIRLSRFWAGNVGVLQHVDDRYYYTSLIAAVNNGSVGCLSYLISAGADLDAQVRQLANGIAGDTALIKACYYGYSECANILLVEGADARIVSSSHGEELKRHYRLTMGWDGPANSASLLVNAASIAAYMGHLDCLRLVLNIGGASINEPPCFTPLHCAALEGHVEVCQFLLENGASVNVVSELGETPLSLARLKDHFQIVALLHEAGAVA